MRWSEWRPALLLPGLLLAAAGLGAQPADPTGEASGIETGALLWLRGLQLSGEPVPGQRLANAQLRLQAESGAGELRSPRWVAHLEGGLWRSRRPEGWAWLEPAASERGWQTPRPRRRAREAASLQLDWAYLEGRDAHWQYSLGRQPISRGLGRLWSVLDLHAPFQPTDLERLYKPGVDALWLERQLGPGLASQSLISLRREAPDAGRSAHWQQGLAWQGEQALGQLWLAGRSGQRLLGLGAQRLDWLGGDWYAELLLHRDDRAAGADWQRRLLLGAQYRLAPRRVLGVELLQQSEPAARALPRLGGGRHYLAGTLGWELHPLLQLDLLLLRNGSDASAQGLAALKWQAREALELRASWSAPLAGGPGSEYRRQGRVLQLSLLLHY
ncbi:hypothetical protein G8A07_12190 [Roseateles sp. DAIF2]|uniref:hypothetical protein n=1 Tax=Roseateles sp. DAIF2 TaxID=2714952 RepID=UPI0018A2EF3B|nr:hypothetical protein [Roseateles sp. DAIF2]QPF73607.1 hypothetical protein G8A07_12190 [Roseateles sp. DAIF2]